MKRRIGLYLSLSCLAALHSTAQAGPLPFTDLMQPQRPAITTPVRLNDQGGATRLPLNPSMIPATPATFNLYTSWGFGQRENLFNELIVTSVTQVWEDSNSPLPPALYKSLIATESSFNPAAVSYSGAAGLTQLMPDTAKRFGLRSDERLDPKKAVPAGIQAFQEKYRVVLQPANYPKLMGQKPEAMPWSVKVADYYSTYGEPTGDDRWHLALAAYNGGGGTILRAMAYAIEADLDPRIWENLAGAPGKCHNSPLHKACLDVYGPRGGKKVHELANYPRKIMNYYRSTLAASTTRRSN